MIIKVKKGWKVVNHKNNRSFGTYPSYKKAVKRLRQIKWFGRKK